jgi:hypothetical protein
MNKKYIVRLTDDERAVCEATIKKETGKSQKLRRATIWLQADADGPAWDDAKISAAVGCRSSWLHIAECELSCWTSSCLSDRRISDLATLLSEITAWSSRVHEKPRAVAWPFTIDKAWGKWKRLYPKV